MRFALLTLLLAAGVAIGCGKTPGTSPIGHACTSLDDCVTGLACLEVSGGSGGSGGSCVKSLACTRTCNTDADCTSAGAGLACGKGCSTGAVCLPRKTTDLPAAAACSDDGQCHTGLKCLGLGQFNDGGCTEQGKACSTACAVDADCSALGTGFKCFAACGGAKNCGKTG